MSSGPKHALRNLSVPELVQRFTSVTLAQSDAVEKFQTARYNQLFDEMERIRKELRARDGDQRRALIPLLDSENVQVRAMAANSVLAIAPLQARAALETVRNSGYLPQSADAWMMLDALDAGTYVPD